MNLIVAVDENWGIGYQGDLLVRISEDMKFFKKMTTGKNVIMGRITFDSLPNRKPLPDRKNFVLTTQNIDFPEDVIVCKTVHEIMDKIKEIETNSIFIIGGEKIYKLFLPYCQKAYITKIHQSFLFDKKIINFDKDNDWLLTDESEIKETKNGIKFHFTTYIRKEK